MDEIIRRKLSMAARALDFAKAHPVADTSFATVVKRLEAAVTRGDAIAIQATTGKTGERAAQARRRELKQSIRRNELRRLVSVAKLAEQDHPELKGQFLMPSAGMPNKTFLLAAQALLAAAVPNRELFVSLGVGDTFIEDLTQATAQLDGTTEIAHSGRVAHVGATTELENLVRASALDVQLLGTYYRAKYPKGSETLAGWESSHNLAGPFLHQPVAPAPGGVAVAA